MWRFLVSSIAIAVSATALAAESIPLSDWQIGYTECRTDIPAGRHANIITMRAYTIQADGSKRVALYPQLSEEPNSWTQFAGWSPDGRYAIVGRGWEDPENAKWEEEHKDFRFSQGWLYDTYLADMQADTLLNITAVDRVSTYNSGLFFWPKDPNLLGFTALIEGKSHPFSMALDGTNKKDLTTDSKQFSYGFNASPDGSRIAFHQDYVIVIANADGSNPQKIDNGNQFNFAPTWSPDGKWLLFVSGEHYNCHPYIVAADGTGLRKMADRGGYTGVVAFLDVPDFHGGSSDVPVWSMDTKGFYYTTKIGDTIELMYCTLDGTMSQLTTSAPGVIQYHPKPSPDGQWLLFGSTRDGARNLYVMPAKGGDAKPVTTLPKGSAAMWAIWRPRE